MGWTVTTYANTYMGGQPSNARVALFELIRAVRERKTAAALAASTFYKANGSSTTSAVSLADLENIKACGANPYSEANLIEVKNAIAVMANSGLFYTDNTYATPWTLAGLETAVGEDLDAAPIKQNEARFWQAMQDALDLLIYLRIDIGGLFVNRYTDASGQTLFADFSTTRQPAWDGALDNRFSTAGLYVEEHFVNPGGTDLYWYEFESKADIDFNLSSISVAPDSIYYELEWVNSSSFFTGTMEVSLGSTNVDYSYGDATSQVVAATLGDFTIGTTTSIPAEWTNLPSSPPFGGTYPSAPNGAAAELQTVSIQVRKDLTSYLTDQA